MSRALALNAALLAWSAIACSPSGKTQLDCSQVSAPTLSTTDPFIAFNPAFADYTCWPHVDDPGPSDSAGFPAVALGPRTQYINVRPPADATEFPIGTIIVEVRDNGTIFAGVKHGDNFNSAGAVNWEWFELEDDPKLNPEVQYLWRGLGPPDGETYGGDANGACNTCHARCADNDYVCSPHMQLAAGFTF